MTRSSEVIDLNQWVYRDAALVADPLSRQITPGSTTRNVSIQAAKRAELMQALADRRASRQARPAHARRSLLARLRLALIGPAV